MSYEDGSGLKENNHHLFSYNEVVERLKEIYGIIPKSDKEHIRIQKEALKIWKGLPKYKIDVKKHKNLHKVDFMTSSKLKQEYKRLAFYVKQLENKLKQRKSY